jgi:membrane protein YqaA with SNARE-associated domain
MAPVPVVFQDMFVTIVSTLAVLFFSALTSATLLPGSSEAVLLAFLAAGRADIATLLLVATAGNVLGSCVNWWIGGFLIRFSDRRWFPVKAADYRRAEAWYARYGVWSLLISWVPIIGDPLTVVAGALRVDLLRFLVFVTLGKGFRYGLIAFVFLHWQGS